MYPASRRRLEPPQAPFARHRWLDLASVIVFCVAAVTALVTARDYGISWDEPVHTSYGDALFRYFETFGEDQSAVTHRDHRYGPAYDLFGSIVRRLSPFGRWTSLRLSGAFVGILGLLGAFRVGRLLGGPLGGLLALVFLWATPVYYGHIFNNPKDAPFAAAYVWAVYYVARVALEMPRVSGWVWAKLGLVLGLAMAVRIGGLLVVGYAAAIVLLHLVEKAAKRPSFAEYVRTSWPPLLGLACTVVLGYGVMVALWPWAQQNPFGSTSSAVNRFTNFTGFRGTTLYDGRYYAPSEIPRFYALVYFVRKMPESVLALLAGSGVWVVLRTLSAPFRRRPLPLAVGAVFVSAVAPLAVAIWRHMPVYDGIRHLLFIVPASCAMAGIAAAHALRWLFERQRVLAVGLALPLVLITADTAWSMIELHPYQYVHYNRSSGGYAAAEGKWDTDYYGHSYKEAYSLLIEHLWRTERERYLSRSYVTSGADSPYHHHQQSPGNFDFRGLWVRGADFYTSGTRFHFDRQHARHPIITKVERQGTILNVTRDLRRR